MSNPNHDRMAEYRQRRAEAGPLPTAEQIAAPIMRSLYQLWDAFADHTYALDGIGMELEAGTIDVDVSEHAAQVVALATEVAAIVTTSAGASLNQEDRSLAAPLRSYVMAVTGAAKIDYLRRAQQRNVTVGSAGLDLRPLLALREPAAALMARLQDGDLTAAPDARALLDQEEQILDDVRGILDSLGIDDNRTHDAAGELVSDIGTGDLGYWLDVAEGRVPRPAGELAS